MKQIKLTQDDLPDVKRVLDAIANCIESLPDDIYGSDKFALLVSTAMMNLLCTIVVGAGATKEEFLKAVEDTWNSKFSKTPSGLLN